MGWNSWLGMTEELPMKHVGWQLKELLQSSAAVVYILVEMPDACVVGLPVLQSEFKQNLLFV